VKQAWESREERAQTRPTASRNRHDSGVPSAGVRLLPGASHFRVEELPAYAPSGSGEHLYVFVEKEDLSSDEAAERLRAAMGRPAVDVGYAGRKDRHGVTRQWLSVRLGDEAKLADLGARLPRGRLRVLEVARDRNKLRPGHLLGNRFELGLDVSGEAAELEKRLADLARDGVLNRFGAQRFGIGGSSVAAARALGRGDVAAAIEILIDPSGAWRVGAPLPPAAGGGPVGAIARALRREPDRVERALAAAGPRFRRLLASAAQSAVFNAVLDARRERGLVHRFRAGDVGLRAGGGLFRCRPEELDDTNARARPGVLAALVTGPLPGHDVFAAGVEAAADERAWSAGADVDWTWFDADGPLASPGDRRALVVPFLEPPALVSGAGLHWLRFALPAGSYATEVLEQLGVALPRRGMTHSDAPALLR
jgi:tRNA pseudouridine13 synthase